MARRSWQALFIHRISLLAILLIAALALLPIAGVNDQMPDTQRAWIEAGPGPFLITTSVVLVVAFGLFFVGRRRSQLIWRLFHTHEDWLQVKFGRIPGKRPYYWLWLAPPVLLATGSVVMLHTPWDIYWPFGAPLIAILSISFVVVGVSLCLEKLGGNDPMPKREKPDYLRAWDSWRCGDVLSMVFVAIAGMSLVRSFTAPLVLAWSQGQYIADETAAAWLFFVLGVLTVVLAFPAGALVNHLALGKFMDPRTAVSVEVVSGSVVLFAFFATMLTVFVVIPVEASGVAGVPGTATLLACGSAVVIGLLVVSLQDQRPLRIFASMGLTANPILTLIAVTLLAGTSLGGTQGLHSLRPSAVAAGSVSHSVRPTVEAHFEKWLKNEAACTVDVGGTENSSHPDVRVRPMILVAAEGGGIRAASWTVRAFEKLAVADKCAKESVILSSGVSGGSLGLTLSRLYDGEAMDKMKELAKPGPLGAAVTGAIVGDTVAAGTGLKVPTRFNDPATGAELLAWNDRAGLVESLWEQSAGKLASPFDANVTGPTGALLLNSTDTGTGCRVVISQLRLPSGIVNAGPAEPGIHCTTPQGFPTSVDLLGSNTKCPLSLRWSTATLLSGRFPIISPAGRIPVAATNSKGELECQVESGFQLIDGGYSEGSALGTITDVWPNLQAKVLQHNYCVVQASGKNAAPTNRPDEACDAAVATKDIVVPVFLFLQNSPGSDIVPRAPQATAELLVPIVGLHAKNLQVGSAAWIQRLESDSNVCPAGTTGDPCVAAVDSVRTALGGRSVVVVAPNSVPALAAPLGWSLSEISQQQLGGAMDVEADSKVKGNRQPFGDLLAYLGG
ncbi:hypothetical protein [Arthrobacter sp. E3]|uniref:hypothetical protein n=1 Tax=Arthrobacter sp. E3 TaxID=517402 RepID=UPI001A943932|nr:hypothetical protein [Arthrobacter sp. E3]